MLIKIAAMNLKNGPHGSTLNITIELYMTWHNSNKSVMNEKKDYS